MNSVHSVAQVGGKVFNKYASIKVSDSLEIKDICRWAAKIHPRDVTDLKPMFILMQGLLRDLLDDKFKFYSEENDLLRVRTGMVPLLQRLPTVGTLLLPLSCCRMLYSYRIHI